MTTATSPTLKQKALAQLSALRQIPTRLRATLTAADQPLEQPLPSVTLHKLTTTPPTRVLRTTLWALLALVVLLLIWALTARLDIVAAAPGKLVPASQVKIVQAAQAGIVRVLLVQDGDRVASGQLLIRMDATLQGADAGQIDRELALKRITVRAIDHALANQDLTRFKPQGTEPRDLFAQVAAQFQARQQALQDALAQEEQAATRARNERLAALQVRDKLQATLPVVQQSADSFEKLQKEGFVGELLANEKKREAIECTQDLKAQEATLHALDAAITEAQSRSAQLHSNYRSQLLNERIQAQAQVEHLLQEQTKQGFRTALLEVRAPQAGTVQNLATHTPGAVVQPGTALLTIVPSGDTLRAEAALANEDVGFVEIGQRVRLKLAAYPFQKYGLLEGRVTQISADAQPLDSPTPNSAPPLTYKAVIELNSQTLTAPNGQRLTLTPGMAATAEIHQGTRTVMEYLLSPVQKITAEAGRER